MSGKFWTTVFGLVGFLLYASSASAALVTNLEDATNGGGFFGKITIAQDGTDQLKFTLDISNQINIGLTQGDILRVAFDVAGDQDLSGATYSDFVPTAIAPPVFDAVFSANNIVGFKNGNKNNNPAAGFDLGIDVGTNGSAAGFNQTVMFKMTFAGLTEAVFDNQRASMRVQSINSPTFGMGASSKLLPCDPASTDPGCTGDPGTTPVPEPTVIALLGAGMLGIGGLMGWRRRED